MQTRSSRILIGAMVVLALVSWGGLRTAKAETLELSAIFTADCALPDVADGANAADLSFLDSMQADAPPAGDAPKVCKWNKDCHGKKHYCAKENGACKSDGTCKEKPVCTTGPVDPVCGCNGKTYSSECMAHAAGVNVDHAGKCEKAEKKM